MRKATSSALALRVIVAVPAIIAAASCNLATPPNAAKSSPTFHRASLTAEFERYPTIWLGWSDVDAYLPGHELRPVLAAMIRVLAGHVDIRLVVPNEPSAAEARRLLQAMSIDAATVQIDVHAESELWLRDVGPVFVRSAGGRLSAMDFGFNGWGYYGNGADEPYVRRVGALDRAIAGSLNLQVADLGMIVEGGALESNGAGTLLAVEDSVLGRNPQLDRQQIEALLAQRLDQRRVIWLAHGLLEDTATFAGRLPGGAYTAFPPGGHVDEVARFADEHTVLLAEVTVDEARRHPIAAENRRRLEAAAAVLRDARDAAGAPLRIVRIPHPEPLIVESVADEAYASLRYLDGAQPHTGDPIRVALAASYLNFVIANDVVLMPIYGHDAPSRAKDARARRVLESAFPGRTIAAIDATALNTGGGGMHCVTRHQPY